MKPISLSNPEALAAQQARATGTVDSGAIAAALAHLEDALPPGIVPYLRRTAAETSQPAFPPVRAQGHILATLERGLLERRASSPSSASCNGARGCRRMRYPRRRFLPSSAGSQRLGP
jgi:hypothetical protein